MTTINNFDDMIQFIKEHDLTPDQTHELVKTFGVNGKMQMNVLCLLIWINFCIVVK